MNFQTQVGVEAVYLVSKVGVLKFFIFGYISHMPHLK